MQSLSYAVQKCNNYRSDVLLEAFKPLNISRVHSAPFVLSDELSFSSVHLRFLSWCCWCCWCYSYCGCRRCCCRLRCWWWRRCSNSSSRNRRLSSTRSQRLASLHAANTIRSLPSRTSRSCTRLAHSSKLRSNVTLTSLPAKETHVVASAAVRPFFLFRGC